MKKIYIALNNELNYEKYKEFSYPRFIYSCFCFM